MGHAAGAATRSLGALRYDQHRPRHSRPARKGEQQRAHAGPGHRECRDTKFCIVVEGQPLCCDTGCDMAPSALRHVRQCALQGIESRYKFCIVTGGDNRRATQPVRWPVRDATGPEGGHDKAPSVPRHSA